MAELSQFFGFTGSWAESMLRSYSKFQNSEKEAKRGRPPVTNPEDDKCLLEFITKCYGQRNPPTIAQTVAFLQARARTVDRHWVAHFIERHATEIKQATATYMEAPRHDVSQLALEDYFKAVDLALRDVDPRFVFNVDETRVHVKNPSPKLEVLIPALASSEHLTIAAVEDGTNLSLVGCISASGSRLPPYFISTRMTYDSTLEAHDYYLDEDFFMARTENSFITEVAFLDWFTRAFLPYVQKRAAKFSYRGKFLLFIDGHASHCTDLVREFCARNNTVLLLLVPHSSHVAQPLDLLTFSSFKRAFARIHAPEGIKGETKYIIRAIEAWEQSATKHNNLSSFHRAGIYFKRGKGWQISQFTVIGRLFPTLPTQLDPPLPEKLKRIHIPQVSQHLINLANFKKESAKICPLCQRPMIVPEKPKSN
jgi:hypothetical protein